ncbi:hypothetical protein [Acinetobacter baumannii]|uniref:hypothetical protein n=1 Tax=Acinetobacter baumannii TaxID=470 RepID=UPI001651EF02|nr:hypothetical protein [Acinetobacter baumannii]MBC6786624.1 hypothetical protein [Acinetobacter baumannii]
MFSTTLMDLSKLRKHLCVPLFLFAIFTEFTMSKDPLYLTLSTLGDSLFIKIMVYTLGCIVLAFIIYFFVALFEESLFYLDNYLPNTLFFCGYALIGLGLLVIGNFVTGLPSSVFNIYWHFGFLAFGFDLLSSHIEFNNKKTTSKLNFMIQQKLLFISGFCIKF